MTTNILLTNLASNGVSIVWDSDIPTFVSTNGVVTRPTLIQGNTNVILTGSLFRGSVTNTKRFSLTILSITTAPDLIVSMSASRAMAAPSDTIILTARVSNTGTGSSAPTILRWYLSTNNTIDTNDTPLGTNTLSSLGAGSSNTETISITVPNTLGTYYYGVCVDNVIGELETTNNCSSAVRVLVTTHPHLPTSDFTTLSVVGNIDPRGIWSDGTTMWVADPSASKIYAYSMSNKAHVPAKDFTNLSVAGNDRPHGIWSDGSTMWVADTDDDKIYAYALATKVRIPAKDFTNLSTAGNTSPSSIWSDGITMWVADPSDDKIFAYSMSTKVHVPAKDLTLDTENNFPQGIWSDGTTMWVADSSDDKIFAYSMSTKAYDSRLDFTPPILRAAGNYNAGDIWSDGSTMWVSDEYGDKLYAYDARFLINTNSLSSVLTRVAEIATAPDLIVTSLSASTNNVTPSEMITLTTTVMNTGTEMAAPTVLRWYRSTDSTISSSDTPVGMTALSSLASGGSSNTSISITVPNTGGTNYYGACVDSFMGEHYTNNNCSSAVRVVVILAFPLPTNNFNTLSAASNNSPYGIWSDGTTMWVVDPEDDKLYAYDIASKARVPAKDFNNLSNAGNIDPQGIWSDGTTMWISDSSDEKLYAYSMSTKARDTAKEFNTLDGAGNTRPVDIWSDGTTMWVSDNEDAKIYAYSMSTKARDTAKEFNTLDGAGNRSPLGIWSDGTTMWVIDLDDSKSYAYDLASNARVPAKDFALEAENTAPYSLWSDGTTMWVSDWDDDKIYTYNARGLVNTNSLNSVLTRIAFGRHLPTRDFNTLFDAGNTVSRGIWSDGTTMWVADTDDDKLYAYSLSTKARVPAQDFNTLSAASNNTPEGIWSDGTTLWVADWTDSKIYAYDLSTKARNTNEEFNILTDGTASGIWSDGSTMWVANTVDDKLYAYSLSNKARVSDKDFTLTTNNKEPRSIWSDGITMWVVDRVDQKIYTYSMSSKAHVPAKDFTNLSAAGNAAPNGIWSDGTIMWVSDDYDGKLYAYDARHFININSLNSILTRLGLTEIANNR